VKGSPTARPPPPPRASSPTPVPQIAGAGPPVRVSQVQSPDDLGRRDLEDLNNVQLSKLKGAWREGVFKQTTMDAHRSAISCLHLSGNCLLSGGFDGTLLFLLLLLQSLSLLSSLLCIYLACTFLETAFCLAALTVYVYVCVIYIYIYIFSRLRRLRRLIA